MHTDYSRYTRICYNFSHPWFYQIEITKEDSEVCGIGIAGIP